MLKVLGKLQAFVRLIIKKKQATVNIETADDGTTASEQNWSFPLNEQNEQNQDFVGTSRTQTITNKTIDADNNLISNIGDEEIKAGIDATKIADGSVDNTAYQKLGTVGTDATGEIVDTDSAQTLTNKTVAFDQNTIIIPDNSVDGAFIADNSIANSKLIDLTVEDGKIRNADTAETVVTTFSGFTVSSTNGVDSISLADASGTSPFISIVPTPEAGDRVSVSDDSAIWAFDVGSVDITDPAVFVFEGATNIQRNGTAKADFSEFVGATVFNDELSVRIVSDITYAGIDADLKLKDESVSNRTLAPLSVSTSKIRDKAVLSSKMEDVLKGKTLDPASKVDRSEIVVKNLSTAPNDPDLGEIYFDTIEDTLFQYTSEGWKAAGSGGLESVEVDLSVTPNLVMEKGKAYLVKPDETDPANNTMILPTGSSGTHLGVIDINSRMGLHPVTIVGTVDGETDLIMDVAHSWVEYRFHVGDNEYKTTDPYGAEAIADGGSGGSGSGSGEINYVLNSSDADEGWTGASTTTTVEDLPLYPAVQTGIDISSAATYPVVVGDADQGKLLKIEFWVKAKAATTLSVEWDGSQLGEDISLDSGECTTVYLTMSVADVAGVVVVVA